MIQKKKCEFLLKDSTDEEELFDSDEDEVDNVQESDHNIKESDMKQRRIALMQVRVKNRLIVEDILKIFLWKK
jgi:hypothetical protein